MERLSNGDERAFETIWERHQGPVYRYAWHLSGSRTVAEETTQETFLVLIQNPHRFDATRGTLGAFLYGIARNCTLKRLRDNFEEPLDDGSEPPASDWMTEEHLLRSEAVEQVRTAVASLPWPYREAVVLCDLEELSYEEAASLMRCAVGTVRSRLSRARRLLVEKLKGNQKEASSSCGLSS